MREIKFRAWDKKQKIMRDWHWITKKEFPFMPIDGNLLNSDDYELMQYTGLHDNNGVEIYEGDILQYERIKTIGYHTVSTTDKDGRFSAGGSLDNYTKEIYKTSVDFRKGSFGIEYTSFSEMETTQDRLTGWSDEHDRIASHWIDRYENFKVIGNIHEERSKK